MIFLRQSTQTAVKFGPFVSPSDGVTLVTSLVSALDNGTTGIMISKNGGANAVRHGSPTVATTYDSYGDYVVTLDTTDTNTLGRLRMIFQAAASCLPVWRDFHVIPAAVYDQLVAGTGITAVGTASAGAATTLDLGTASPTFDITGYVLAITAGTGAGQLFEVGSYNASGGTDGHGRATRRTADGNFATTPDNTSVWQLLPSLKSGAVDANGYLEVDVEDWKGATAAAMTGDAYAYLTTNLGALGANLTAVGDTRLAVLTATMAELAQGVPPTNPTLAQALMALYMALVNGGRVDKTAGYLYVYNRAGTCIFKQVIADSGTAATRAVAVTGP